MFWNNTFRITSDMHAHNIQVARCSLHWNKKISFIKLPTDTQYLASKQLCALCHHSKVSNEEQQLRGKRKFEASSEGQSYNTEYLAKYVKYKCQVSSVTVQVATVHFALIHKQAAGSECRTPKSLWTLNRNSSVYWNNKQFVLLLIVSRCILTRVHSSWCNQNFVSRL
jgi:hypothetical protein